MIGSSWLFSNPSPSPFPISRKQKLESPQFDNFLFFFSNSSLSWQTQRGIDTAYILVPSFTIFAIFLELPTCPDKTLPINLLLKTNLERRWHFNFEVTMLSTWLLYRSKILFFAHFWRCFVHYVNSTCTE